MSYLSKYEFTVDSNLTEHTIRAIQENLSNWMQPQTLTKMLGLIDLTTLNATDTPSKVSSLVNKVNRFHETFPNYPTPASICVYPNKVLPLSNLDIHKKQIPDNDILIRPLP